MSARAALGSLTVAVALSAAPADAATLVGFANGRQPELRERGSESNHLRIEAAAGTLRFIPARQAATGSLWFAIQPQGDCTLIDTPELYAGSCPLAGQQSVYVSLGFLDDSVRVDPSASVRFLLYGGAGDDRLEGGPLDDQVVGGPFDDTLGGGRGNDAVRGDTGIDRITDLFGDNSLSGGAHEDVVIDGTGASQIAGGDHDDRLIDGGGTGDRLIGGTGDDRLSSRDRHSDTIACGTGHDVAMVDRRDTVLADCEVVSRSVAS